MFWNPSIAWSPCLTSPLSFSNSRNIFLQVRSTTLDTWLPNQVAFITAMGNQKANRYWERRLPSGFKRPTAVASLSDFIRNKYVDKTYVPLDMPPPDMQNYQSHPYCMDEKTPVAVVESPAERKISPTRLQVEPPVVVNEPVRKTPLVIESDFISLSDDPPSIPPAPKSLPAMDWEPFPDDAGFQVESSGASWNAFDTAPPAEPSWKAPSPKPNDVSKDPFGLDALQTTPKAETTPSASFDAQAAPSETTTPGQQSTEDILKLYDLPKRTGEPLLPPNLGLPMGPPPMYPYMVPSFPSNGYPPMGNGHLYPQVAVPHPQNMFPAYGTAPSNFQPSAGYPPQFYGQGHK